MIRIAALATVAVLAMSAISVADERGEVVTGLSFKSDILDKDVGYTVYFPPGYDDDDRVYPVIYLMHGGGDGKDYDWYQFGGADRTFDEMINSGEVPPFIAITPDGRRNEENLNNTYYMNDADGVFRWEDMFIEEFIPYTEREYPLIATKESRAIAGLSMGGYAALAYSLRHPELFSGAVALSAAFRTDPQIVEMDQAGYDRRYGMAWGLGLEGEARLNDAYRAYSVLDLVDTVPAEEIGRTKYYVDNGADDSFFDGNVVLHQKLRDLGIEHRFMIREGDHEWVYWRTGLPEGIRFLGAIFRR